jgi:hypothetical protein
MRVKVLPPVKTKLVSSPAVLRDSNHPVLRQIFLFVLACEVVGALEDDKGRNSPPFSINAVNNCCPLPIAWLDFLWFSSSLRSWNNCSSKCLAHHEACLVEVVRVVIQNAILGFGIGYQAEPALDYLRILAEGSIVVVLAIELHYKLWLALDERTGPV